MFYLVDWYEDPSTPDIIGQYETKKEKDGLLTISSFS